MKYILLLLLFSTGILFAQGGMPDFGDGDSDAGTFTGSGSSSDGTSDKSMGFGKKAKQNAEANERLQEAKEKAAEKMESSTPTEPDELNFEDAEGLGYYYLEQGDTDAAAMYLDLAGERIDAADYEAVLGLFTLYELLAQQAKDAGNTELADQAWNTAEALTEHFFTTDPVDEDSYAMHEELAYAYYELGYHKTAAEHFHHALEYMPEEAYTAYMVASCLALTDDTETALDYLEYALAMDLLEYDVDLADDSDLDAVRDTDRYQELAEDFGF
ncbi:hypothetical protein LEM8419_00420 [Neolewinella maritima]|uniref:Tetratricopeptide repeat protein n=1 Tax=Neolewinella maritima TaxID=1383882 RepID=A0ABM9AWU1_9BACT|nr:hypothetical protein [Neolewinella maritima]CAH0999124.1 hypothetical protein LEM8419_00420 [Neolewinella maritima]